MIEDASHIGMRLIDGQDILIILYGKDRKCFRDYIGMFSDQFLQGSIVQGDDEIVLAFLNILQFRLDHFVLDSWIGLMSFIEEDNVPVDLNREVLCFILEFSDIIPCPLMGQIIGREQESLFTLLM